MASTSRCAVASNRFLTTASGDSCAKAGIEMAASQIQQDPTTRECDDLTMNSFRDGGELGRGQERMGRAVDGLTSNRGAPAECACGDEYALGTAAAFTRSIKGRDGDGDHRACRFEERCTRVVAG